MSNPLHFDTNAGEASEVRVTRTGRVGFAEKGLPKAVYNKGVEIGLEDTIENIKAEKELLAGERAAVLVDFRVVKKTTQGARKYLSKENMVEYFTAAAPIIGSPIRSYHRKFFPWTGPTPLSLQTLHRRRKGTGMVAKARSVNRFRQLQERGEGADYRLQDQ